MTINDLLTIILLAPTAAVPVVLIINLFRDARQPDPLFESVTRDR